MGIEQPDVSRVPLDVDPPADPAGRRPVVGRRDLDAAVQMHGAVAVLGGRAAASSSCGRRQPRPCLCDLGRRPGTAGRRPRNEPARRG